VERRGGEHPELNQPQQDQQRADHDPQGDPHRAGERHACRERAAAEADQQAHQDEEGDRAAGERQREDQRPPTTSTATAAS
jgi:hypothetical protein